MVLRPFVVGLLALVACGEADLECGDGTVERDGECVLDTDDDTVGPPGTGLGTASGNGTGVATGTGTGAATGTGTGMPTSGPILRVRPNPLDLGVVDVPCTTSGQITLENIGTENLVVQDLRYEGGDVLSVVDAGLPALPFIMEPGETIDVDISATPVDDVTTEGTLTLVTNDARGKILATQTVSGAFGNTRTEVLTSRGLPQLDVLLMVDNSCSMPVDNQDDFDLGAPLFVERLNELADWQLIEVVEDSGCKVGGILDSSVPNAAQLIADFAFSARVLRYVDAELLLQQAELALSQAVPGGCNEGFLRPDAHLAVVIVSNEPEQSGRAPHLWVDDILGYVASDELLTISGVVDSTDACPDGYYGTMGDDGYDVAIALTDGIAVPICPTWGADMANVLPTPASTGAGWVLSEPAIPESLDITVEGVPATRWDYNEGTRVLMVFEPQVQPGDEVIVRYAIEATCP